VIETDVTLEEVAEWMTMTEMIATVHAHVLDQEAVAEAEIAEPTIMTVIVNVTESVAQEWQEIGTIIHHIADQDPDHTQSIDHQVHHDHVITIIQNQFPAKDQFLEIDPYQEIEIHHQEEMK